MKRKEYWNSLLISLIIPILFSIKSENKMLSFLDTWTIIAILMIAYGLIVNLSRKGHFDLFRFATMQSANRLLKNDKVMTFIEYRDQQMEERKDKINAPLRVGCTAIIICFLLSLIY